MRRRGRGRWHAVSCICSAVFVIAARSAFVSYLMLIKHGVSIGALDDGLREVE